MGSVGEMALKLDMNKAYNKVEWVCLEKIMEILGFAPKWKGLIMQCITSITYFIRINGKLSGKITPSRDLCQGDPLSPYLFLLCAEGLSALVKKVVSNGSMEGVSVCRGVLGYLICFLHMTVLFSVKKQPQNVRSYKRSYRCMRKLRGSS